MLATCTNNKHRRPALCDEFNNVPDSKVHGANVGPTWVLSAPDGPHVGPMNLAIRGDLFSDRIYVIDAILYWWGRHITTFSVSALV